MRIFFILMSVGCLFSCSLRPSSIHHDVKGLRVNDFLNSVSQIMPKNYEISTDTVLKDGAWKGVKRVMLVDKNTPHYIRWENKKGIISKEKIGYKAIKFLISTDGDRRKGGIFTPDRGEVFYRSGSTFIYAIRDMVYESDESERRLNKILEDARWTSPMPDRVSWKAWSSDIKNALRKGNVP